MVAALVTLALVAGTATGLVAGYAIFRIYTAVSKRMKDPTGFVLRLPRGVLVYCVMTSARQARPEAREARLPAAGRMRRYSPTPEELPKAA